jgi:iron complex transport system ATP-binding protein
MPGQQRARQLAVLPQGSQLNFSFKAIDVVRLGLTPLSLRVAESEDRIQQLMHACDVWLLRNRDFTTLSGGEQQRVQLARVLVQLSQAQRAPALLLDEPTSAQDLGQQHKILALAQELAHSQGYLVIAVLHDLNQVLHYCDQTILMADGQMSMMGTPQEILTPRNIEDFWYYRAERFYPQKDRCLVF